MIEYCFSVCGSSIDIIFIVSLSNIIIIENYVARSRNSHNT